MNVSQQGTQSFGEFFRNRRIAQGLTLRTFCERYGYDPGNISRLERNILPPSTDGEKLSGYTAALKIKKDSKEWVQFHDLVYITANRIPADIKDFEVTKKILPAFFRTVRNKKMDKEKLEKLLELLNE